MLYVEQDNPEYERNIERIVSNATLASTEDGMTYYVARPGELERPSLSLVNRQEDLSEVTLVVSYDIPDPSKAHIAELIFEVEAQLEKGRYALAEAANSKLKWDINGLGGDFREYSPTISILGKSVISDLCTIQSDESISPEKLREITELAQSFLGWASIFRGIDDTGAETEQNFMQMGLWIPHSSMDNIQMTGLMNTKKGAVKAGFKLMTERNDHHKCADCSLHILKNFNRVTLDFDQSDGYSNHHHYHYTCFLESILPKFTLDSIEEAPLRVS